VTGALPYLAGKLPPPPFPLGRYLPWVGEGVASGWLRERVAPGAWVLDPFGAAPRVSLEAARAGYRVLVAAHNPVARFLIEMAAGAPDESEWRAALAELAAAYKGEARPGGERLEPHLQGLYRTECNRCGQTVFAEAFIWEKQAAAPLACIYKCPRCGDTTAGEHPITPGDAERAAAFAANSLHRARALERVAPLNDPDRVHAEEALEMYLPRAVYALFTLINKLDGVSLTPTRRRCLQALILTACDQANTLWPYPAGRERPRQLSTPPRFRENNVWLALEHGIELWLSAALPAPLTVWPEQPPASGGVCLFEGRLKDLAAALPTLDIHAVLTTFPRPNQAFWTLSALWSGWLWGHEALGPFKSVLRRRRYDWAWHTAALYAALSHLTAQTEPGTPLFGMIGEVESGFLSAALVAADAAGLDLHSVALKAEQGQAQILWVNAAGEPRPVQSQTLAALSQSAAADYLCQRGEPADYLSITAAALSGQVEGHAFRSHTAAAPAPTHESGEPKPAEDYSRAQAALREALSYRGGFLRYGAEEAPDSGQWWLRDPHSPLTPLADRVEMALVNYLIEKGDCTLTEIEQALHAIFPGLLTPSSELIHACLESYGEADPNDNGRYRLRQEDQPMARRADLALVGAQLAELGRRLGFDVTHQRSLNWVRPQGQMAYRFFIIASAVLGEIILQSDLPPEQCLIVLPGGRANLVAFKLRHDLRLAQAVQAGWRFCKFRHVRWLQDSPLLDRETLDEQLALDPLTYTAPQMRLL